MKWYFLKIQVLQSLNSFLFSWYFTHCFAHYLIINMADMMSFLFNWVTNSIIIDCLCDFLCMLCENRGIIIHFKKKRKTIYYRISECWKVFRYDVCVYFISDILNNDPHVFVWFEFSCERRTVFFEMCVQIYTLGGIDFKMRQWFSSYWIRLRINFTSCPYVTVFSL